MAPEEAPYPPSWINRLTKWIERLPFPLMLSYLLLYILSVMYIGVGAVLSASFSMASDISGLLGNAVWIPVPLAALHYLSAESMSALATFRPAMNWDEDTFQRLKHRLAIIPSRPVLVINALTLTLFSVLIYMDPQAFVLGPVRPVALAMLAVYTSAGFSLLLIFVFQTIRQLSLVTQMYSEVEHVNVFHLEPLYAFSGLTAKTAAAWILLANLTLVINVLLDVGMEGMELSFWVPLLAGQILLACLAFFVPLWGVHQRIQADKQRVLEQNSERLEMAYRELERRMAEGDLQDMDAFQKGAMALMAFRKEIESISTWPWQPATFRGFLSAVFLPIFLFVVQQILAGFIAS